MRKLQINLKSSNGILIWLIISHLAALVTILLAVPVPMFPYHALPAIALISCSFYHYWRFYRLQHSQAVIRLLWAPEAADWLLFDRSGQVYLAKLLPDSICTMAVVLLKFKSEASKKVFQVLIPRDAVALDEYKHLQRLLRLQASQLLELP